MLFILVAGNTTWWEKLKVWRLEINENIVIIGQCKAVVCLLTSYKAKIGVSRCGILLGDVSRSRLQQAGIWEIIFSMWLSSQLWPTQS